MDNLLVIIAQDDWSDAFINGERVTYGHSLDAVELLELLQEYSISVVARCYLDADVPCLEQWRDEDVFGSVYYSLPNKFATDVFESLVAFLDDENSTTYRLKVACLAC